MSLFLSGRRRGKILSWEIQGDTILDTLSSPFSSFPLLSLLDNGIDVRPEREREEREREEREREREGTMIELADESLKIRRGELPKRGGCRS